MAWSIVAACSSPSQKRQLPPSVPAPTPPDAPAIDAPVTPPSRAARGERCSPERACGDGLTCAPLAGGYCTSLCELGCADGACVQTARAGELCMQRCDGDRDCRADEGYVCDAQWKACLLPNLAAIVPRTCPARAGVPAQDTAFAPSAQWSTAALAGAYQLEPSAALTDDGGLVALYISRGTIFDPNTLGVSRVDGKGAQTIDVPFTSERANHFDPWLARDRKGVLHAVWLGFDSQQGRQEIGYASSRDRGVTWTTPVAVHEPGDCPEDTRDCLDKPMVVVGPDPKRLAADIVYVMYAGHDSGLRVRASRDRGATFGATTTATVGVYGNATVSSDGALHVVTINGSPRGAFGSAQHAIEYTQSRDGGVTFRAPVRISGHEEMLPFFFSNPSVVVDSRRKRIYAAYVRGGRDATWEIVLAVSSDNGATWRRQRLAGDGCAIHMVPNLALDPTTGTLHVAYYDTVGSPGRFVHASCAAGGLRCKTHGAINTVPFATLTTVRHSPRWIGEYQSLVVDAKRRVLHAVWSQVIEEAGANVSRIFHSTAKLK